MGFVAPIAAKIGMDIEGEGRYLSVIKMVALGKWLLLIL